MKKPAILTIIFILLVTVSQAQNLTDKKQVITESVAVSAVTNTVDLPFFASSSDAEKIVAGIMNAVGLEGNFKIKVANVPNVEATVKHHERYILYNPEFVTQVNSVTKNKWASIFILAHEVGHHLEGHTIADIKSSPGIELQADQFAGFVLCKMGATLKAEAQMTGLSLNSNTASQTIAAQN